MRGYVWREMLHRPSDVPGLAYELTPNMRKRARDTLIKTNGAGMRDRELPIEKGDSTVRIAAIGDSVTFGFGLLSEYTYPKALERLLNGQDEGFELRFEVLNFGVGGYSTRDEALVLRHKVGKWRPDVVIVGYVLNDPEFEPAQPLHEYFNRPSWWQYSDVLRRFAKAKRDWDVRRLGDGDYFLYLHAHPQKWRSVVDAFRDIVGFAESEGINTFLVIFPRIPTGEWSAYPYGEVHHKVALAARREGLFVIDLLETYTRFDPHRLRLSHVDPHPSRFGQALAAEAIGKRLRAQLPALFNGSRSVRPSHRPRDGPPGDAATTSPR